MSADTVDDLHAAEEFAASAVEVLRAFRADYTDAGALDDAVRLVDAWDQFCRPTCGAEGDPSSDECGDDTCGCPCGHNDTEGGGPGAEPSGIITP